MSKFSVLDEVCRECRDILPYGVEIPKADFILWGKFFELNAFGPRCAHHAARWFPIHRADQYAVLDLRQARQEQQDLRNDLQHIADQMAEGMQTLAFVADRMDAFAYDELSSVLSDQVHDDRTGRPVGTPSLRIPTPNVPFGPEGVLPNIATADYLEAVVFKIVNKYAVVGGSNVTNTVVKLLMDTAKALRKYVDVDVARNVSYDE